MFKKIKMRIKNIAWKINQNDVIDNKMNELLSITKHINEEIDNITDINNNLIDMNFVNKKLIVDSNNFNLDIENVKKDKTPNKILIAGFYGALNTGDELMLLSLLKSIKTKNVYIMLSNNEGLIPKYQYGNIKFLRYPVSTADCEKIASLFEVIIWGGGAHIDDTHFGIGNYPMSIADMYTYINVSMIQMNKKVISLSLSTNKYLNNHQYLTYLKYIINNSYYFSLRDENSIKTIQKYIKLDKPIKFDHDLVFLSDSIFNKKRIKNNNIKVITFINIYNDELYDINKKIINKVNKFYNGKCEIRLLEFYNYRDNDYKYIERIKKDLSCQNIIFCPIITDIDKLADFLLESDLVISERYHGILLANILGIDTISVLYSNHPHYYNKIMGLYDYYKFNSNIIKINDDNFMDAFEILLDTYKKNIKVDLKKYNKQLKRQIETLDI